MTTIKFRRDTSANWTSINPIPAQGEPCYETDTGKLKIGNGSDSYTTLPYVSDGSGSAGDLPIATATTLGGVKVGNNLSITEDGVLSSTAGGGDVSGSGDNTFTGTNDFNGAVNLNGLTTAENLTVARNFTSSGEINAVSIKSIGIRSDDIKTTTNKKYLTEEDVDNQTIQVVEGKLHANLDELGNEINDLSGRVAANEVDIQNKQNILSDGNGTKVANNKVDIYQGNASIIGLNLYQNNGTITKNNDLSITFNNGACGYIFLENKGINNDYEIILHQIYLGTHGLERDSNINGVRCLPQAVVPTLGEIAQGSCWFDTFASPFRVVAEPNGGSTQTQTVDNINYIKYVIKGTNLTISYSSTGEVYTELYSIAISSTYYINVCIANSPWQNDIANKWTNTTLFPDSYILDKTTNTYLMKQGTSNEGVAVATSNKYGLVLPDNSTIVSNNGVLSSITPNNMVTTDTEQTISGDKTFTRGITTTNIFPAGEITFNSTSQSRYINYTDTISGGYHAQNGYLTFKGDTTLVGDNKLVLDGRAGGLRLTAASSANITCENELVVPNIRTTANGTIKLAHPTNAAGGLMTISNNYGQLSISTTSDGNNLLSVARGTLYVTIDADKIVTKDASGNFRNYINSQNIDTTYMKWDDTNKKLKVDTAAVAGLAMPSDKYIDLTLGANGTTYTAPANGWFQLDKIAGIEGFAFVVLKNNTSKIRNNPAVYKGSFAELSSFVPAIKGDTISVGYNATGKTNLFRFIYAQGAVA